MPGTTQPATTIGDSAVWMAAAFLLGAMARDMAEGPQRGHVPRRLRDAGARHLEGLTHGETRVLHYLPTNLSAREIADELYLSVNTVKTHQRHLYQKLGARTRSEAVAKARDLGLLTVPGHTVPARRAAPIR